MEIYIDDRVQPTDAIRYGWYRALFTFTVCVVCVSVCVCVCVCVGGGGGVQDEPSSFYRRVVGQNPLGA